MVQTEQQYICIHQCLLVVLEGKEGTEREIHDNQGYEGMYSLLTIRFTEKWLSSKACKHVLCWLLNAGAKKNPTTHGGSHGLQFVPVVK